MDTDEPIAPEGGEHRDREDLTQRLARYRARLVAEGRMNAVQMLDRALGQSSSERRPGRKP